MILKHLLRELRNIKWHCLSKVLVVLWHAIAKYVFWCRDKQWYDYFSSTWQLTIYHQSFPLLHGTSSETFFTSIVNMSFPAFVEVFRCHLYLTKLKQIIVIVYFWTHDVRRVFKYTYWIAVVAIWDTPSYIFFFLLLILP